MKTTLKGSQSESDGLRPSPEITVKFGAVL